MYRFLWPNLFFVLAGCVLVQLTCTAVIIYHFRRRFYSHASAYVLYTAFRSVSRTLPSLSDPLGFCFTQLFSVSGKSYCAHVIISQGLRVSRTSMMNIINRFSGEIIISIYSYVIQ